MDCFSKAVQWQFLNAIILVNHWILVFFCKIFIVTFIVKTPTVQEYIDHIPWYFSIWSRYKEVTNVNSWCDSLETFIRAHKHTHECTQVLVKFWINGIRCKLSDTIHFTVYFGGPSKSIHMHLLNGSWLPE